MGVQLVLSQIPGIAVPHLEQVGTQCSIAVKERDQQLNNIFKKKINYLPEQLMVLFCGVSSQQQFSGLSLELSCALKIDMSRQWRQHGFSLISLAKVQPTLFLRLGMVADNLQDALSYPNLEDRTQYTKRVGQNSWQENSPSNFSEKGIKVTSLSEANSPSRAIPKG